MASTAGLGEMIAAVTPDTASNIGAGAAQTYTFTVPRRRVIIFNDPASPGNLRVRWNASDAAAAAWDVVLEPGNYSVWQNGDYVGTLSIYADAAVTFGTHFTIKGW